jgi:hypothetical protein
MTLDLNGYASKAYGWLTIEEHHTDHPVGALAVTRCGCRYLSQFRNIYLSASPALPMASTEYMI